MDKWNNFTAEEHCKNKLQIGQTKLKFFVCKYCPNTEYKKPKVNLYDFRCHIIGQHISPGHVYCTGCGRYVNCPKSVENHFRKTRCNKLNKKNHEQNIENFVQKDEQELNILTKKRCASLNRNKRFQSPSKMVLTKEKKTYNREYKNQSPLIPKIPSKQSLTEEKKTDNKEYKNQSPQIPKNITENFLIPMEPSFDDKPFMPAFTSDFAEDLDFNYSENILQKKRTDYKKPEQNQSEFIEKGEYILSVDIR